MALSSADFWLALLQIIWINILLSGDNAVVIALAARSLPPSKQKLAITIGSVAAIAMRIVLTLVAVELLQLPYVKIIGAIALLYIGISLMLPENDGGANHKQHATLLGAIRTILIADLVMSLDNVVAVAAAAMGDITLLIVGLAISIPLVIFGSTVLLKVIERFPVIVWIGAAVLGFIAGELLVGDPLLQGYVGSIGISLHHIALLCGAVGALIVFTVGKTMAARRMV